MSRSHRDQTCNSHTPGSAAGQKPKVRHVPRAEGGRINYIEMKMACDNFFRRTGTYSPRDFAGRPMKEEE